MNLTKHTITTTVPADDMSDEELADLAETIDEEVSASMQAVRDHIAEKFPHLTVEIHA